jgi:hypothetical protein
LACGLVYNQNSGKRNRLFRRLINDHPFYFKIFLLSKYYRKLN